MATYISILRGINVSGQRMIKMDALKQLYERLGLGQVKTYVQSGNVVFWAEGRTQRDLEQSISAHILQEFGYEVPALVFIAEDFRAIAEENPFLREPARDAAFLHVTFLTAPPYRDGWEAVVSKKAEGEELALTDRAVYLFCPHGYGRTKLTNGFIESKLKVGATTRNWKTVTELVKTAQTL